MLKEVNYEVYCQIVPKSLFNNNEYLLLTSKVLGCAKVYYIFYNKQEPVIAYALFKSGKKVILPNFQFLYTDVWLKYPLDKKYSRDYLFESLKSLKAEYHSIKLMLPPDFKDIRPFLWNGFSSLNRYTYQKKTSEYNLYKSDVKANYQKAIKLNLEFKVVDFTSFNWDQMHHHLIDIGYSNKDANSFKLWFKELAKVDVLSCVEIIRETNNIGGAVLLVDRQKMVAYLLLLHTKKDISVKEANAFLYIETTKYLHSIGIEVLDFMGANIRSVADFKQRFMPDLTPYFLMEFKGRWFDFSGFKRFVKAILVKHFRF